MIFSIPLLITGLSDSAPSDSAQSSSAVVAVEIRTASDGSFYVADAKRKADEIATPPPKKRKPKTASPPPAPVKPAPVSRVSVAPSQVITQVLAGLDQYPDDDPERFPEMFALVQSLRNEYATFGLQRLLAALVSKIVRTDNTPAEADAYLHHLLLVCFGYGSASQEARVILRQTIKLPNFISKDSSTAVTSAKHCKSLLGINFPHEQQATVIGLMRGLWHVFGAVHLLPTVYLNGRWVYRDVSDCVNKAVSL